MPSSRPVVVRYTVAALLLLALSACKNPQREALSALKKRGVTASASSLLSAVQAEDVELTKLLLQARVYTGQRDAAGNSPLHIAIDHSNPALAMSLIEGGSDLAATTPEGVTPVALAVFRGETAIGERLIDAGAAPVGKTPDGDEVLTWAIRHGRLAFVQRLMKGGADPHQKDAAGNPLLHVAIESGRRDLMAELLKLGADAAAVNGPGESSLVAALRRDWRDLAKPLVLAGADPNLPDCNGKAPLQAALDRHDLPMAKLLVEVGARPLDGSWSTALWKAYGRHDLEVCRLLMGLGISPETRDAKGRRPVEVAMAEDRMDFLHLFLSYGANGDGLFYEASRRGAANQVDLILAHCGLPRALPAPHTDTPLGLAIRNGDRRTAALLLAHGASPKEKIAEGQQALQLAVVLGRAGIVKDLLAAGADPNAQVELPASESFIRRVNGGTMRWLLKHDRNITPLMLATDSGSAETARALLKAGARTEVWSKPSNIWPINIAARKSDVKMMRVLLGKDPNVEQRRIVVDLSEQRAWLLDSSGLELYSTKISSGRAGFSTPVGTYAITNKYKTWTSTLYHASMPFFQRLSCGDFGFHQGEVPGYPASHGCIRVPSGNATKLFSMTELGDRVEIRP